MMPFPWLRELLGYNEAKQNGVAVATRNVMNFVSGAIVTDNPQTGETDVIVSGSSLGNQTRVFEVGKGIWQYQTIQAAIDAINSDATPPSTTNRCQVLIYPGKYVSSAIIDVPSYVEIKGVSKHVVQLQNDTTDLFRAAGNNTWFSNFLVEGSTTTTVYAFDANDKSAFHVRDVDLLDNGGTARQHFLKQSGANWTVLAIERCVVDYNGLTGYACSIANTSGAARVVDAWIQDCFFDAFALTGASGFGGSFTVTKCRDVRFWRNTIRGTNADNGGGLKLNTGIRVNNGGSTGITCEIAHCFMCGAERGSGGVACFPETSCTIFLDNSVARGATASGGGTLTTNNSFVTA